VVWYNRLTPSSIAGVVRVILFVKRNIVIAADMRYTDLFRDIILRIHDLLIGFENPNTEELPDYSNRKQGRELSYNNPIHISYKALNILTNDHEVGLYISKYYCYNSSFGTYNGKHICHARLCIETVL
jgi:hypothetical protein